MHAHWILISPIYLYYLFSATIIGSIRIPNPNPNPNPNPIPNPNPNPNPYPNPN